MWQMNYCQARSPYGTWQFINANAEMPTQVRVQVCSICAMFRLGHGCKTCGKKTSKG